MAKKPDPNLFLPDAYVKSVIARLKTAKTRVRLITAIMNEDKTTKDLITALCQTAERGVDVEVAADIFTYGVIDSHGNYLKTFQKNIRRARAMRRSFIGSGVTFRWLGSLGPFIFAGRTHVKWCVIDDYVFSFGGVNLYRPGLSHTDYMIGLEDPSLADKLADEHRRIDKSDKIDRFYRSHNFECSVGTVLVDGGLFNNSVIYKRVCALAAEAERVLYVSQYCPTGRLSMLLKKSSTTYYFNHWKLASGFNRILIRSSMSINNIRTDYRRKRYIHAKFMVFTMPDNSKIAITGSHNFVRGGVVLGTREIALETANPTIIAELERFWKENIA